jgi:hypothetical protein
MIFGSGMYNLLLLIGKPIVEQGSSDRRTFYYLLSKESIRGNDSSKASYSLPQAYAYRLRYTSFRFALLPPFGRRASTPISTPEKIRAI